MYTKVQPFLLYALSSVHAGSGSELGLIDNPVQRETHTGYPKINSSSLKGAIRSTVTQIVENNNNYSLAKDVYTIFGSEPSSGSNNSSQAGAVSFSDARLLLFPIKSLKGTFTYMTCPGILQRFNRELKDFTYISGKDKKGFQLTVPSKNTVSSDTLLVDQKKNVILDEYTYEMDVTEETKELANQLGKLIFGEEASLLSDRLVVLNDDDFSDFVRLSMEVNARIKIDQKTGIVVDGALFYEENIPPESVFYSFLFAGRVREHFDQEREEENRIKTAEDVMDTIKSDDYFPEVFQLGGGSTLGRGILKRLWIEMEEGEEIVD